MVEIVPAPGVDPNPLMILPFVAMLVAIAAAPVVLRRHWERHYHWVAAGLGAIPVAYYLLALHAAASVARMAHEYISFIVLVGALFAVAGNVDIAVPGGARPGRNLRFLALGALAANLIGTTGAAMLLIRPWIRMNRGRFAAFHTVFFILIVANSGGCLTPIGNPPLFLGLLKGVPFWWVFKNCWGAWLLMNSVQLAIFYFVDRRDFMRSQGVAMAHPEEMGKTTIRGAHNFAFFGLIVAALFLPALPFLREGVMIAAVAGSWLTTRREIRDANRFTTAPIREVAWLFGGLFATMLPALDYLHLHASRLGLQTPGQFYWAAGGLSAVLDNAPTYLAFSTTAFGLHGWNFDLPASVAAVTRAGDGRVFLLAISLGSVFFGALTYLGNGPNLMVKSITEAEGLPTPNFAAYFYRYSALIVLPLLVVIYFLFF